MLRILILCLCCTGLIAEDSPLARRMAAEIVEQAAQDNKAYREVLLDVGKALRSKDISVSQAKDLLSLAASCRQLGATRQTADRAAQKFENTLSNQPQKKGDNEQSPHMLDIDKLIDEEKIASATDEKPLFEDLKKEGGADDADGTSGGGSGGGYHGGLAGRKLPWQDAKQLAKPHQVKKPSTRSSLEAPSVKSVNDKMLKRASAKTKGEVKMVKPGMDGLPQHVLINFGAKDGIKDKQSLIISRGGKALVKAVVIRLKDFESFAVIMNDTWASGVEKELKIGDVVNEL